MAPFTSPPLAATCAENIALLHLLHPIPAPPSRNPTDSLPPCQKAYTLSFPQERSLTGILAFLSNLKDGPEHIPAVCVQEDRDSSFVNVLIAVNRAYPRDGDGVLQDLKSGFDGIFTLLSQVSNGYGSLSVEDQVFNAIISMCSVRILCRLRFTSNSRNTPRQPIKELLQEAVNSIRQLARDTVLDSKLLLISTLFVERAKEVIKLVDAWSKHRIPTRLGDLVEGVYRLWRVGELQTLFSTIPNRTMDPSRRKNVLNIISKVARYREAARFLYREAKEIPLLRQMKIVLVSLPQKVFHKIPANQHTPTLPSAVSRISALHGQQYDVGDVCRLLGFNEVEASKLFAQQTKKTLKEAKIHAEIQLLFYCELHASKFPIRVICSTKDACFLCDAYMTVHGKIHTPRCHGRLYPGWRLPFSPTLEEMEQRFNRRLEDYIRDSLTTLHARRQKTVYPVPNESTLLTLPMSASTLRSLPLPESIIEEERGGGEELQPEPPDLSETEQIQFSATNPNAPSNSSGNITTTSPVAHVSTVVTQPPPKYSASQTGLSTPSCSGSSSSGSIPLHNYTLQRDQTLSKSVKLNHASPLYTAGPLKVQIEYSTEPSQATSHSTTHPPSNLSYRVKWLTVDEAERVLHDRPSLVFEAESLDAGIERDIGGLGCFYITHRGSTMGILLHPIAAGLDSTKVDVS